MTLLPEALTAADHWQPAVPTAPAQRPTVPYGERPSLSWTPASSEQQGARPGQLSGVVPCPCLCEYVCDVFGALMISSCFACV